MTKRIVVFNHKGGVSKTTTVYNLGWMLSRKHNVLVVDADPQCNLSGLFFGDCFEKYYFDEKTKNNNIKDGVSAAFLGRPFPIEAVNCYRPKRSPRLFLLPGHANLSEYDASLTFAQMSNNAISTLQNLPGAFSELLRLTEEKYSIDFTVIDLNPSLSSINQNLFLSSHAFIVPTNPDPFSIMAINTLSDMLPRWSKWKKLALSTFADSAYPLLEGTPKFVGSIIQRFNIRNGKPAKPYRDNISEIKKILSDVFLTSMRGADMALSDKQYGKVLVEENFCLAEIPDFQGLLPKAYQSRVPIFELTNDEIGETGPILEGMSGKRDHFNKIFSELSERLIAVLKYA